MTKQTKFAIVELNSQADIFANLQSIEYGIKTASERGADFVILPENAFYFGRQSHASQYFDALKDWSAEAARLYGVYLLAGTLPCPYRPDGSLVADGKFRQTSLIFDLAGDCLARYDKIHLFKATVNDSTGNYDESKTFEPGEQLVVAKTEFGKIGMMVCFDIRFPTFAIKLRQLGADILTAPSAFTYQTGKAHWHALLTARALDSQCMVVGAGQTGDHVINPQEPSKIRSTWGHSEFINSHGEVVIGESIDSSSDTNDFENIKAQLPLCAKAKHWFKAEQSAEKFIENDTINHPPTVILADFDKDTQQQTRQNIALMDCQKLSIIFPTSSLT